MTCEALNFEHDFEKNFLNNLLMSCLNRQPYIERVIESQELSKIMLTLQSFEMKFQCIHDSKKDMVMKVFFKKLDKDINEIVLYRLYVRIAKFLNEFLNIKIAEEDIESFPQKSERNSCFHVKIDSPEYLNEFYFSLSSANQLDFKEIGAKTKSKVIEASIFETNCKEQYNTDEKSLSIENQAINIQLSIDGLSIKLREFLELSVGSKFKVQSTDSFLTRIIFDEQILHFAKVCFEQSGLNVEIVNKT